MSAYASLADLLARYREAELVQLTDDAGAGVIDQGKVGQALTSATSEANGYIASVYRLPIDPVPDFIVDAVCAIARHRLYREDPPESVKDGRAAAIKALEAVARGTMKIDSGTAQQAERPGAIVFEGQPPLFGRDKMKGF